MPSGIATAETAADPTNKSRSDTNVRSALDNEKSYGWKKDTDAVFESDSGSSERRDHLQSAPIEDENRLSRPRTRTLLGGRIRLRAKDDDDPSDWWFASTAIPLLSATFAPMANLLSIAALVVYWRNDITTPDVKTTMYSLSVGVKDPAWCLNLNGASLACGFVGNIFLLCNFTKKIRYIIALPVTIFLFYVASGVLIGITVGMHKYDPIKENQVYSQGFWYAVIAACLYMGNAMLLMVNMLGYFRGHYPQHFDLNDEQRNLILQTMIFFIWLGGGAGIITYINEFPGGYSDALYFCDVTLLTIGFGDLVTTNDVGRGIVFPYTVGGTIILGLMVSSIHKFAQDLSKEKIVKKHVETRRVNTLRRAVTLDDAGAITPYSGIQNAARTTARPLEANQIQNDLNKQAKQEMSKDRTIGFHIPDKRELDSSEPSANQSRSHPEQESKSLFKTLTLERVTSLRHRFPSRHQKAVLMRSEKDRFDKMRDIQFAARRFKKWYALAMSVVSFGLLWCVGAVVFWCVEAQTQGLTYFQALYFCYVSLLTIGYGDLSPRSNAGKPFFVFWSLIAVPTMTILVSDLGDTAIGSFKRKVLEYGGLAFLGKGRGWGLDWFTSRKEKLQRRLSMVGITYDRHPKTESGEGYAKNPQQMRDNDDTAAVSEGNIIPRTIDELVNEDLSVAMLTKRLAYALQGVQADLKKDPNKRYSYEEWVEFTRLIRFTRLDHNIQDSVGPGQQLEYDEAVDGLIEWDWLDQKSPMTSEQSEAQWVMDRLLESLIRTFKRGDILANLSTLHDGGAYGGRSSTGDGASKQQTWSSAIDFTETDEPQWSKRGKARLHRASMSQERKKSSV